MLYGSVLRCSCCPSCWSLPSRRGRSRAHWLCGHCSPTLPSSSRFRYTSLQCSGSWLTPARRWAFFPVCRSRRLPLRRATAAARSGDRLYPPPFILGLYLPAADTPAGRVHRICNEALWPAGDVIAGGRNLLLIALWPLVASIRAIRQVRLRGATLHQLFDIPERRQFVEMVRLAVRYRVPHLLLSLRTLPDGTRETVGRLSVAIRDEGDCIPPPLSPRNRYLCAGTAEGQARICASLSDALVETCPDACGL